MRENPNRKKTPLVLKTTPDGKRKEVKKDQNAHMPLLAPS